MRPINDVRQSFQQYVADGALVLMLYEAADCGMNGLSNGLLGQQRLASCAHCSLHASCSVLGSESNRAFLSRKWLSLAVASRDVTFSSSLPTNVLISSQLETVNSHHAGHRHDDLHEFVKEAWP